MKSRGFPSARLPASLAVCFLAGFAWGQGVPQPAPHRAFGLLIQTQPGLPHVLQSTEQLSSPWVPEETFLGSVQAEERAVSLRTGPQRRFYRLSWPTPAASILALRDLPVTNSLLLEDFNSAAVNSFLTLQNGISWSGNSQGVGVFPWNGLTNDPRVIFNLAGLTVDFLTYNHLRLRHCYTGGNSTTLTWANPVVGGQEVSLSVRTNLQTALGNRAFPVAGNGLGFRVDPVPGPPLPAGEWRVDHLAVDRGRVLGWEFDEQGNGRGGINNPVVAYGFVEPTPGVLVEGANGGAVADGLFQATVTNGEPRVEFLVLPAYGLTNFVDTSLYKFVELRLRTSTGGVARLKFGNGSGGWNVNQPDFTLPDDGAFHTWLLDFRGSTNWGHSPVTSLALSLPEVPGMAVELDYLRLRETAVVPGGEPGLAHVEAVELEIPALPEGGYALQSSPEAGRWVTEEELTGVQTPTTRFRIVPPTNAPVYRLARKGAPPQLVQPPGGATNMVETPFIWDLPPGTFSETDGHELRFAARLPGGLPLPNWLTVNPTTGRLTGTAPWWIGASNAASVLTVEIVADDQVDGTAVAPVSLAFDSPGGGTPLPKALLHATQLAFTRVTNTAECWVFGDTNRLGEWAGVRSNLTLLKLYIDTVNNATAQQLQDLAAVLNAHHIQVAIELGGLLGQYAITGDTNRLGEWTFNVEMAKIQRWLDAGGRLHQLQFDDPINRAFYPKSGEVNVETGYFTLATATEELIEVMKRYRQVLPEVQFVYLPNFPNWGWDGGPAYYTFGFTNFTGHQPQMGRGDFKVVLNHLLPAAAAAGVPFWAICADHPRDYFTGAHSSNQTAIKNSVNWRQRVRALEIYAESKGLRFFLIANDETTGNSNATDFQNAVADYIDQYQSEGGSPYAYNIQSWYAYPTVTLPETVNGRLAKVILHAYGSF